MQKALTDDKQLLFFADLWLDVLNDAVDSQADFQASIASANMDFTSIPGQARLGMTPSAYSIDQRTGGTLFDLYGTAYGITTPQYLLQQIKISPGRDLNSITVKVKNTAIVERWTAVSLYYDGPDGWNYNASANGRNFLLDKQQVLSKGTTVAAGFDGEKTFPVSPSVPLNNGYYWLAIGSSYNATGMQGYRNTSDVYSAGSAYYIWANFWNYGLGPISLGGDAYFKLDLSGYNINGSFTTKTLNLGSAPDANGTFQMACQSPSNTTLQITLKGSATGDFTGEETTFQYVEDGEVVPPYQYWRATVFMSPDASASVSPSIDMLEILCPKDSLKLRVKGEALKYVDDSLLKSYQALLKPPQFQMSELKPIERVSSGGTINMQIEDSNISTIQRFVSDSPLKNYRGIMYVGADVPGFSESDLLRFFVGVVDTGSIKPKFRGDVYSLSLTLKNPILELTRKVPPITNTAQIDLSASGTAVNYDGIHVMDAMQDLIRSQASIPARYVNVGSMINAKSAIGDSGMGAAAFIVRRSNAAGLPDTRLKSPEEVRKHIAALAVIADGYIVIDEDSKITFVKHDASSPAEAVWADEKMVKSGEIDAVPIEGIDSIKLGYDDFIFNACLMACEWDGSGSDWKAFSKVFANVNSTSADDWAPGKAIYVSLMEKNTMEASKWLGPQSSYGGESLAQNLSARFVNRFSYPPMRLCGASVRISEFRRTIGSIVRINSREIAKFRRRGIANSETVSFMITSKKYDQGNNRMKFDLMELT